MIKEQFTRLQSSVSVIAANISKFQLVMKPTETNYPLDFEAILHDPTLNTR